MEKSHSLLALVVFLEIYLLIVGSVLFIYTLLIMVRNPGKAVKTCTIVLLCGITGYLLHFLIR